MRAVIIALTGVLVLAIAVPFQGCGDNDDNLPCCPVCGDGVCQGDERSCNCRADCDDAVCAQIVPVCGDGVCSTVGSPSESHERCATDCPLNCRRCAESFQVYVRGQMGPGSECPTGTTEAYREGNVIVCDSCADDRDCAAGRRCGTNCGPGCEDDSGGCCPVRECVAALQQ